METTTKRSVLLKAEGIRKTYASTVAVGNLGIEIQQGDVLALIGANGAGKSTLTKTLSGVVRADSGSLVFAGEEVDLKRYSPLEARKMGIRVVHQELSLCKNLTVYENFYVEQSQRFQRGFGWHKQAREMAGSALDAVFPGHGINVKDGLSKLSIAQQQMVEIARAASDPEVKLLILDEPTSSLSTQQAAQLQDYIKDSAAKGVTYIYISHRLKEVVCLADRVFIMQNGEEKWRGHISETGEGDMIRRMGEGLESKESQNAGVELGARNESVSVYLDGYSNGVLKDVTLKAVGGEVIGLTGLEGNGQLELIQEIFFKAGKHTKGMRVTGKAAYVAGDRKKEGIFPLWSIRENLSISKIAVRGQLRPLRNSWINEMVSHWYGKLRIKSYGTNAPVTSLSGGNQQKVLIARALAVDADIILLDDPTRGVDIATKEQLYQVFREAAAAGKLVIWKTSDDSELKYCTKQLVLNSGAVAKEFSHSRVDHEEILKYSFAGKDHAHSAGIGRRRKQPLWLLSLIAMLVLYGMCGAMSPPVFSRFGIELLAVGFTPFVFAALAQTFIIGLGHIDLGVGAFMGLTNVLCATLLYENTPLGILALFAALLAYACMGLIIHYRNVPAIIITLGMSFVWTGCALSLQGMPGGTTPAWMVSFFNFNTPVLQGVVLFLLLFILLAVLFYRSRYGTVLRGFGNNEAAVVNSGWSRAKAMFMVYLMAGVFAMMGGISFSAITGASDVNASSTFTMLTVAAVIIGGGYFSGGVVTHAGSVFGAVSLTMISVLLGLLSLSTDYTATVQGLVLIVILSFRVMKRRGGKARVKAGIS